MPEFMVSTLAHELHHQWQCDQFGIRYWFYCNFLFRDRLLEVTAREVEAHADKMMGMEGIRDGD